MKRLFINGVVFGLLVIGASPASAQVYYPNYPNYPVPSYPQPAYPQYPVVITQPQFNGFAHNGGIHTKGTTIHNSAFDPYREISKQIGPSWNVNRPIIQNGQVVGWEKGREWFNPVTNQVHGQTQQFTPNGLGGVNTQTNIRSLSNQSRRPNNLQSNGRTFNRYPR